jgi:hypothetical protein
MTDINNNNFPNGLPNGNVNRRIPNWDDPSTRRFSGFTTDDLALLESRRKTRGIVPKRIYDPTIEKESAWDEVLGTNIYKTPASKLETKQEYN